jgi:hypothetical protein
MGWTEKRDWWEKIVNATALSSGFYSLAVSRNLPNITFAF